MYPEGDLEEKRTEEGIIRGNLAKLLLNEVYSVDVEGERIHLEWRDNEPFCQEYDIEAESIAFILTGSLGLGIGTFMHVLQSGAKTENDLANLEDFAQDLAEVRERPVYPFSKGAPIARFVSRYLSYSEWVADREKIAESGELLSRDWRRLAKDGNFQVIANLASRECVPIDVIETLFEDAMKSEDEDMQVILAENPTLTLQMFDQLFEIENEAIWNNLARNLNTPEYILEKLMSKDIFSQECVARREGLSDKLVEYIFSMKVKQVGHVLALESSNFKVIERILLGTEESLWVHLARNRHLSRSHLMKLAEMQIYDITRELKNRSGLPKSVSTYIENNDQAKGWSRA